MSIISQLADFFAIGACVKKCTNMANLSVHSWIHMLCLYNLPVHLQIHIYNLPVHSWIHIYNLPVNLWIHIYNLPMHLLIHIL